MDDKTTQVVESTSFWTPERLALMRYIVFIISFVFVIIGGIFQINTYIKSDLTQEDNSHIFGWTITYAVILGILIIYIIAGVNHWSKNKSWRSLKEWFYVMC